MALIYSTAAKAARMTAVRDIIDGGLPAGELKIYTAGGATLLATLPLRKPCGTVADDVLTLNFDPDVNFVAVAAGRPEVATITGTGNAVVISGLTVGLIGTDITLDQAVLDVGMVLTMVSGTITHAA